jgi:DNA-directed RNA polymerase beta' subunit
VHRLCLAALACGPEVDLETHLTFASAELVRERAPKLVTAAETLDFKTLMPVPGGLFDYKEFGPGTVIDAPPIADDEPVKPRKTQFGRITVGLPIPHPLLVERAPDQLAEAAGWTRADLDRSLTGQGECELIAALESAGNGHLVMRELAILPPDLRPLRRLDDDRWAVSPLNELYRRVIHRNARFAHVVETNAPNVIIASERQQLHEAMFQLFDSELRALCGGPAGFADALRELDRHPADGELTGRLYRTASVLFALGMTREG